jgi:hypothetical protein
MSDTHRVHTFMYDNTPEYCAVVLDVALLVPVLHQTATCRASDVPSSCF